MLGGQIGAMSKQGLGSTFWFTVPLILPEAAPTRRPSGIRRTASWSCRDAFSDGHYDHSVEPRARLHGFRPGLLEGLRRPAFGYCRASMRLGTATHTFNGAPHTHLSDARVSLTPPAHRSASTSRNVVGPTLSEWQ